MKRFLIAIFVCFLGASTAGAMNHPEVTLKDQNGNIISQKGFPVSVRKSCGACHDIDFISTGFHFQIGRLALLPQRIYKKDYYNKYIIKKNHLLPKKLSPVLDAGMYGEKTVWPHPTPLGAFKARNPAFIGLTTPEWSGHCGICHVGGGPMEKDRKDNWLYKKTKKVIEAELKSGTICGDYVMWNAKKKKFVPFVWKKYGINNVAEPSCFLCHSKGVNRVSFLNYRNAISQHYFAAADTFGGGLATSYNKKTGKLSYNTSIDVDKSKRGIQIDGNIIGKSDSKHCALCHAGWSDDIDEDGKLTPMDVIIQFYDPKFLQPDTAKEPWIWYYNKKDKDEKGVAKRVDIHEEMGLGCIDCHAPVGPSSIRKPSHDFAKGNTGPVHTVRWHQLAGTARCQNCHTHPVKLHRRVFGPVAGAHLQKVSCTLCHIGKKYMYEGKLIDETEPVYTAGYDRKNKRVKVENIFIGMTYLGGNPKTGFYPDVGLLPEKEPNGSIAWRYKPVNAAGLPYFIENSTGKFKVLPERYMLEVLRVDPNLPTFYMSVGTPPRKGKAQYLNLQPKGGVIAHDKSLNNGTSKLAYVLPNYIDVNLDGVYDKPDVQITDDTTLNGKGKDGIPEINTLKEVKAAVHTLSKVIEKSTGKHAVVKLQLTFHPFVMSHNIRPKNEALSCIDCHGEKGYLSGHMFTSKVTLHYPYDKDVLKSNYIVSRFPRTLTEKELSERIKDKMIKMGFKYTK